MGIQSILDPFHYNLEKIACKLGYTIGVYPGYFILIPFFISLLGLLQMQRITRITDLYLLFTPSGGQSRLEIDSMHQLFPVDFDNFSPSILIENGGGMLFVVGEAKDGGSMLRMDTWKNLMETDKMIMNTTIHYDGETFAYKDLCARKNGKCYRDRTFGLDEIMPEISNGSLQINYPLMFSPPISPHSFGKTVIDEEEGVIISAGLLQIQYHLDTGNKANMTKATLWEKAVIKKLFETKYEHVNLIPLAGHTLPDEFDTNEAIAVPYFSISVALMLVFSCVTLGNADWVRSKYYLGLVGVACSMLSVVAASGFLSAIGKPTTIFNAVIPFLILGIGLDDQYVLLSGWHRTKVTNSVPERLSEAYSEAAISVTITSLTNALSFLIGSSSSLPAVSNFCLTSGVTVIFTYIWFIFLFGGCMAFAGRLEEQNRHSLIWKVVKPKSLSKEKSSLYRYFCAGGINRNDVTNPEDNTHSKIIKKWKETMTDLACNRIANAIVIALYVMFYMGAIYGTATMKIGFKHENNIPETSYAQESLAKQMDFKQYMYRIQVVINETLTYSDPKTEQMVLDYHDTYENSQYVIRRLFTRSYLRQYYNFLKRRPHIKENITSEADFIRVLRKTYFQRNKDSSRDFVFNDDYTEIVAYRFIIQAINITTTEKEKQMITEMRRIADSAPFKSFAYHFIFPIFDQFLYILGITLKSVCFATTCMVVVAFIFMPQPLSCCAIIFSIISMQIGVVGYLSIWGASLDPMVMGNLIMCIGFTVDFSAHVSYAYITSKAKTNKEKIYESIDHLGIPVLQGGVSTFLAASTMIFAPSYIFKVFFMTILLVIFLGIIHALFLLPMIFSLLGPSTSKVDVPCKTSAVDNYNDKEQKSSDVLSTTLDQNGTADLQKTDINGISNDGFLEDVHSNKTKDVSCRL